VFKLRLHEDAKADLRDLVAKDRKTGTRILAFIEQLGKDPNLRDRLTTHDFGPVPGFAANVKKYLFFWNKGIDLWRLKISDLKEQYRIIYAYNRKHGEIHILGIAHRSVSYDINNPIVQRIQLTYREVCG
jgi:mRNA-degrading endonuclease RelE of RelBE toxin-antitoxin system